MLCKMLILNTFCDWTFMDTVEILSKISLFSLMKKRDLRRISKLTQHHRYEAGDVIVSEGARDGRLFVIVFR